MDSSRIKITYGGRPQLTVEQIAETLGISVPAAYKLVSREGLAATAQVGKVYDQAAVIAAHRSRPGSGAPGRPRGPRAGKPAAE